MRDESIIDLYFQRDENAIQETDKKYGSYCFKVADNILRNREDCEECVNDTWLKTWDSIPPTRSKYLKLFLARITRNLSFNRYREKHRKKRGSGEIEVVLNELEECVDSRTDVEAHFLAKELTHTINQFAKSLPERDCGIFVRRYFFVETIPEIARRYEMPEGNVRVILSRSRKKLRVLLKEEGYLI